MKRKIVLVFAVSITVLSAAPAFSDELSAVWSRLYNTTDSLPAKTAVMQNIVDLHDRAMEPVITEALREILYSVDESRTTSEKQLYDDLTRMMVRELGSLKAVDAAPDIYRVVQDTDDDFLRSTAIVALGNAGARDYADEIAELLRYLNTGIQVIENNEKRASVVDACIFALERLKHPVGFEPVFFASVGRYSRESIKKAERALQNMLEDPTDMIVGIIKGDNTFTTRYAALGVEERSRASDERKNEAAVAAIEVSLKYNALNPTERQYQTRTRVKACEMIRDLDSESAEAVQWLRLMLNSTDNVNELVTCLQALGTYTSDEAVEVLTDYLALNNERRAAGYQYKDERAIRECINALGNSGNPNASSVLMMVEYSNWSNQTVRMAKNALKSLQ